MSSFRNGALLIYAIRLANTADREMEEHQRLEQISGFEIADAWRDGLRESIRSLATLPERCSTANEDKLFRNAVVGQLLYRRTIGGPAWRILFSVREANLNDPPTVLIHHIRHAAQAPITEWPSENE